jgi:hypothetical protein
MLLTWAPRLTSKTLQTLIHTPVRDVLRGAIGEGTEFGDVQHP